MAVPRDPAFWKRFSTAVHMDEEAAQSPDFKQIHQDSWLARQQRKSSRRTWVCYGFWMTFIGIVAAVVIVMIWLLNNGYFAAGGSSSSSSSNASDVGNDSSD